MPPGTESTPTAALGPQGQEGSLWQQPCANCSRSLVGRRAFAPRGADGPVTKCGRCSLLEPALLRRSLKVAVVVGTILVGLNQGDQILAGTFPWSTSWAKIPLTYLVPFCVATYGALANAYQGVVEGPGST